MKESTSKHYLKKAKRFFQVFNLPKESRTPQALCDALKRAARDKDDQHRAEGDINDKKVIQTIQEYGLAKSSWQQLKTAVRYYCEYYGHDNCVKAIEETKMGLKPAQYKKPPKKIKKISQEQTQQISIEIQRQFTRLQSKPKNWNKLNEQAQTDWTDKHEKAIKKFGGLASLISLFIITGCRPIEVMSIKLMGNNVIYIRGAKQSNDMNNGKAEKDKSVSNSTRGADRFIALSAQDYQQIDTAITTLKRIGWLTPRTNELIEKAIKDSGYSLKLFNTLDRGEQEDIIYQYRAKQFQKHLDTAHSQFRRTSKKALKLKKSLCFYTFRHQLASDLKADERYSRAEMAYILGHLATKSIDAYGHRKSANGRREIDVADLNAPSRVRATHSVIALEKNGRVKKKDSLIVSINNTATVHTHNNKDRYAKRELQK